MGGQKEQQPVELNLVMRTNRAICPDFGLEVGAPTSEEAKLGLLGLVKNHVRFIAEGLDSGLQFPASEEQRNKAREIVDKGFVFRDVSRIAR